MRYKKEILKNIRSFRKSLFQKGSFVQDFTYLLSGNVLGQLIGMLLLPIITRMYEPSDYGIFSIFIAVVNLLAVIGTLRYNGAFVLPKLESEFRALLQLTVFIMLGFTVLTTVSLAVYKVPILTALKAEKAIPYWYFLPIVLFMRNITQITGSWNTRDKEFKKLAGIIVFKNLSAKIANISYALIFTPNFIGFIIGEFFDAVFVFFSTYFLILKGKIKYYLQMATWSEIKQMAITYKEYPFYFLPSRGLSQIGQQMPIYILTFLSTPDIVGLYAFGKTILNTPLLLIQNSISPVFLQKANELIEESPEKLRKKSVQLHLAFLGFGAIPFGLLMMFGDLIFRLLFGSEWEKAGLISGYLALFYLSRLIWNMSQQILKVLRKEVYLLHFNIINIIVTAASLLVGVIYFDPYFGILFMGIFKTILYFWLSLFILRLLNDNIIRTGLLSIGIVGIVVLIWWLLRQLVNWWFF